MFSASDFSSFVFIVQSEFPKLHEISVPLVNQKSRENLIDHVYNRLITYLDYNLNAFNERCGCNIFAKKLSNLLDKVNIKALTSSLCSRLNALDDERLVYYILSTPGYFLTLKTENLSISHDYDKKLSALVRAKCLLFLSELNPTLEDKLPEAWFQTQVIRVRKELGTEEDWVRYNQMLLNSKDKKPIPPMLFNQAQVVVAADHPIHPVHLPNDGAQIQPIDPNEIEDVDDFQKNNHFSIHRFFYKRFPVRNVFSGQNTFWGVFSNLFWGTVNHAGLSSQVNTILLKWKNYKLNKVALLARWRVKPRSKPQLYLLLKALKDTWLDLSRLVFSTSLYAASLCVAVSGLILTSPLLILVSAANHFKLPFRHVASFLFDILDCFREVLVAISMYVTCFIFYKGMIASSVPYVLWFAQTSSMLAFISSCNFIFGPLYTIGVALVRDPFALVRPHFLSAIGYILFSVMVTLLFMVTPWAEMALGAAFILHTMVCASNVFSDAIQGLFRVMKNALGMNANAFNQENALIVGQAAELNIPQQEFFLKQPQLLGKRLTELSLVFDKVSQASLSRLADEEHPLGELKNECISFRGRALNNDQTVFNEPRVNQFLAILHEHNAQETLNYLKFF